MRVSIPVANGRRILDIGGAQALARPCARHHRDLKWRLAAIRCFGKDSYDVRLSFAPALPPRCPGSCLVSAFAADKTLQAGRRLDEAAIKLEAQIKSDAGPVTKPAVALRRDADAAFQKNDFRAGMLVLGQLVAVAPDDARAGCGWSRAVLQIKPRDDREKSAVARPRRRPPPTSPTSAPAIRQRGSRQPVRARPDACRPAAMAWLRSMPCALSLDLREMADLRGQYEKLRAEHGFRLLDYTVDFDSVSPRACFQFSEELPAGAPTSLRSSRLRASTRPAISASEKQLCVEGLKHGERYTVTLRAGLPSVVKETLAKSAEFTIFVRDRKPFVRFSGKAYVLPRTGQRGIPVLSVNTQAVTLSIYRIGDRNLLDTLLGYDFQRNLSRYQAERLRNERGAKVWSGELAVELKLNTEVTTAFPLDQAVEGSRSRHLRHDGGAQGRACRTTTASRRRNGSSFPISGLRPIRARRHRRLCPFARDAPMRAAASRCG